MKIKVINSRIIPMKYPSTNLMNLKLGRFPYSLATAVHVGGQTGRTGWQLEGAGYIKRARPRPGSLPTALPWKSSRRQTGFS